MQNKEKFNYDILDKVANSGCVNERLNRQKGTIISTNLSLNRLRDEFTERVTSRILSQYRILPLLGEDLRLAKRGYTG